RIESDSGFSSAPPTPCTARAAISWLSVVASAQAADASVKIARPTRKIRFRPNRSPSLPPSRMRAANVRMYALTVHSRFSGLVMLSERWIEGSATFTTVLSSMIMNSAKHIANSVHHLWLGWSLVIGPHLHVLDHAAARGGSEESWAARLRRRGPRGPA